MLKYELKREWKGKKATLNKCYLWQMIDLYPEVWNNCVDDLIVQLGTKKNIDIIGYVTELTNNFIEAVNIHLDDIGDVVYWVKTGNVTAIDIKQIFQTIE